MEKQKKKIRSSGEGTIYESESTNRWIGQLTLGRGKNGKIIRKSVYGNSRNEVRKKMDIIKKDLLLGEYSAPDKILLEDWLNQWLNVYKAISLKPRTYDLYEQLINLYIKQVIGHIRVQKITTILFTGIIFRNFTKISMDR